MIIVQNVGIDISMVDFQVCFMILLQDQSRKIKGTRKFTNSPEGFKAFRQWVEKKRLADVPLRMSMEATGVYYEALAYNLYHHNYELSVVLPNKAKAYFKSLNLKTKTDKIDAMGLAQFGLERKLSLWEPASKQMYGLKKTCRERVRLLEEKNMISNQLHAEQHTQKPDRAAIKRINQRLKLLDKQLKAVDGEIEQKVEADPVLCQKVRNITQVKGLGLVTVASIIAETNGFALFKNRAQVVSFAGYDVVEKESGTSIKGKTRISKKGNRYIRRALFFPAISVVKYHEEFKQTYQRIFDRTKIKMKGYVAVQRKLLVLIYTLFKNNEVYDPNFYKRNVHKVGRQDTNPAYSG